MVLSLAEYRVILGGTKVVPEPTKGKTAKLLCKYNGGDGNQELRGVRNLGDWGQVSMVM